MCDKLAFVCNIVICLSSPKTELIVPLICIVVGCSIVCGYCRTTNHTSITKDPDCLIHNTSTNMLETHIVWVSLQPFQCLLVDVKACN